MLSSMRSCGALAHFPIFDPSRSLLGSRRALLALACAGVPLPPACCTRTLRTYSMNSNTEWTGAGVGGVTHRIRDTRGAQGAIQSAPLHRALLVTERLVQASMSTQSILFKYVQEEMNILNTFITLSLSQCSLRFKIKRRSTWCSNTCRVVICSASSKTVRRATTQGSERLSRNQTLKFIQRNL